MPNNNKNEFDNKKPSQTQEHAIHKSLNAAILTDIINQNNLRSKTESNNSDKDKEKNK